MQEFNIYLPLTKGLTNSPSNKIKETLASGETRTRYRLKGTISTTSIDRDQEAVSKSCLKGMEASIKNKKLPIFGNHEHSWENMIGYADNAELNGEVLDAEILTDFEETNPKVGQLIGKYQAGFPLMFSIGGKVKKSSERSEPSLGKNIRIIEEVELFEASIVGIGSNPNAFLSLSEQISKSLKGEVDQVIIKGETMVEMENKTPEVVEVAKAVPEVVSKAKDEEEAPVKEEAHESSETPAKEEAEESKAEAPKEENPDTQDSEEADYAKFVKCMQRYLEEVKAGTMKSEGNTSVPGSENSAPKNEVKSFDTFQNVRKAFNDNLGSESIVKNVKTEEADYSFAGVRRQILSKKSWGN